MYKSSKVLLALTAVAIPAAMLLGSGTANAAVTIAYVSPHGSPAGSDSSCGSAGFASINKAISAVSSNGTVVVCRGTYHTQAVVKKPLSLIGRRGAVINATGQKPVLPMLPGGSGVVVLLTDHVVVRGLKVVHAGFDAILVARSSQVLVTGNVLEHNGDVGVDFNGTTLSLAAHNVAKFNAGGGFLIADDLGAASSDEVAWNVASRNPGGCGVIVAGHTTAGVTDNLVEHNLLTYNGTDAKSSGAGVVIATEVPKETVSGNVVRANTIFGNGLAGVTIHSHLSGQHMNGNQIIGNVIGTNNTVGDPIGLGPPVKNKPDTKTTGILVGASSRIKVLIRGNHIHNNRFGIFIEGRVHAVLRHNHFHHVHVDVKVG